MHEHRNPTNDPGAVDDHTMATTHNPTAGTDHRADHAPNHGRSDNQPDIHTTDHTTTDDLTADQTTRPARTT